MKHLRLLPLFLLIFSQPLIAAVNSCEGLRGFAPFDLVHPGILIKSTLTTREEIESLGGTIQGQNVLFNPSDGFNPNFSGGILFHALNGYESLSDNGQFSIDVESRFISIGPASAANFNTYQTGGISHVQTIDTILSISNDTGTSSGNFYVWDRTDSFFARLDEQDSANTNMGITALGKDRFLRLSVSWTPDNYVVAINHRIVFRHTRTNGALPGIFKNIFIGSNKGNTPVGNTWFRNFILSSCPAVFQDHPKLGNVAIFGDSLVKRGFQGYSLDAVQDPVRHEGYDSTLAFVIKGKLSEQGYTVNLTGDGYGGYAVSDTSPLPLEGLPREQMLATNPRYVIFQAGSNDVALDTPDFEVDLKDHLTTILNHPSVEKVIVSNIPSMAGDASFNTIENIMQIEEYNRVIAGLDDWWNSRNPNDQGRIVLVDLFDSLGGEQPLNNVFDGQVSGEFNNLHISAKGQRIMGELFSSALMSLANPPATQPVPTSDTDTTINAGSGSSGGGCTVGKRSNPDPVWLLILLSLAITRRLQRNRNLANPEP